MAYFVKVLTALLVIESLICLGSSSVLLINDSEPGSEEYDKNDILLRENRYRKLADEDASTNENEPDLWDDYNLDGYDLEHDELNEIDLMDDLNEFDDLKKENYKHLIDLIQAIVKANKENISKSKRKVTEMDNEKNIAKLNLNDKKKKKGPYRPSLRYRF